MNRIWTSILVTVLALSIAHACLAEEDASPSPEASAATPSAGSHTAEVAGDSVKSTANGYSLKLPTKEWTLHPFATSPIQNSDADAEFTSKSGGYAILIVEDASLNTKALSAVGLGALKKAHETFKEASRAKLIAAGQEGIVVTGTSSDDGTDLSYWLGYLSTSKHCYQFICWSSTTLFADCAKEFEALASSLKEESAATASPSPAASVVVTAQTVTNTVGGYAITMPSDKWRFDKEAKSDPEDTHLESKGGGFAILTAQKQNLDENAASKLYVAGMSKAMDDVKQVSRGPMIVGGLKAMKVVLSGSQKDGADKLSMKYQVTTVAGANQTYQIMCWSTDSLFDDNAKDFDALTASFHEAAPAK